MDGIARIVDGVSVAALGADGGIISAASLGFGVRAASLGITALGFGVIAAAALVAALASSSAVGGISVVLPLLQIPKGRVKVQAVVMDIFNIIFASIDQSTTLMIVAAAFGSRRVGFAAVRIVVLAAEGDAQSDGEGREGCDDFDDG